MLNALLCTLLCSTNRIHIWQYQIRTIPLFVPLSSFCFYPPPLPLISLVPTILLPEPSIPSQLLACQVIWINVLQIQQQIWEWSLIIMHAVVRGTWVVLRTFGGLRARRTGGESLFLYLADSVGSATRRKLLCTKNIAVAAVLCNTRSVSPVCCYCYSWKKLYLVFDSDGIRIRQKNLTRFATKLVFPLRATWLVSELLL